jgi:ribonucleotide reductase beta subunit family protein with ferritin-like domain
MVPAALKAQTVLDRVLVPDKKRLPDIWKMYKLMEASFWTLEEIDLSADKEDFDNLPAAAQRFLKHVLAFFAVADGFVVDNLVSNFCNEMDYIEVRFAYQMQEMMEQIHSETYSAILGTLITDDTEREQLIRSSALSPHIAAKTDFCTKYMAKDVPFSQRVVAFAAIEGIHFSSSFAAIYWVRSKAKMPGLCFSNELIARDEGMHRDLGILVYKHCEPLGQDKVTEIVSEAVDLETEFVRQSLPDGLLGLPTEDMVTYVKFVADHLLVSMGYEQRYKVKNPLIFMEMISLQGKTNFFEKRVSEYAKQNVASGVTSKDAFTLSFDREDLDF